MIDAKNLLQQLYFIHTGIDAIEIEQITGSGSNRSYFRIRGKARDCIGVYGESIAENKAFIELARHFREKKLPVPLVYAVSDNGLCYLQEDLGNISLFDCICRRNRQALVDFPEKNELFQAIRYLPHFQFEGADGWDFSQSYPVATFNTRTVAWDLNYFKYCFLKPSGIDFSEPALEDDFDRLTHELLSGELFSENTNTFMYRDFQSRNVLIKNGKVFFIDFQGGQRGPVYYDLASFVWQAKADFSLAEREELITVYLDELQKFCQADADNFRKTLRHYALFRTLQVLGAYGFRGCFEKKAHFLQSIPLALKNANELLLNMPEYPHLSKIITQFIHKQQDDSCNVTSNLLVTVYSFSYKKGIPEDDSGNGGGFVFDCRSIHNPGRYAEYRHLTGLDKEVVCFLEKNGEVFPFLDAAYALADTAVKRYIERDFTRLMFAFGCTGGQHRSVYCAQKLTEHLTQKFAVNVKLIHREFCM
ncbi:MAG: phosphotransferase [Bacteroidales bacterium]|jgi:aminoglycoside/choline kinase family phosphotransferase|nr:phosphotransferase [Bacteroidales bacterium]